MVAQATNPLVLAGTTDSGVLCRSFAHGQVCVKSQKEPGKEGQNEDALAVFPCGDDAGILLLADGMGGANGGDLAAKIVIEEVANAVAVEAERPQHLRTAILDALERANQRIIALGMGAATTVVVMEINGPDVRTYHAGDSVAMVVGQRGKLKYQTIAHSPVGYALESGLLPENEAMQHDERHVISNAVGSEQMRLEMGPLLRLQRYDTVLLGSDGLFDNLTVEEINAIIRCGPLDKCAERLTERSQRRMVQGDESGLSKPDDLSFILFRG